MMLRLNGCEISVQVASALWSGFSLYLEIMTLTATSSRVAQASETSKPQLAGQHTKRKNCATSF